jgi:bifunctional non-homologous end joining protein LigD
MMAKHIPDTIAAALADGDGPAMFLHYMGLEGIVSKRRGRPYRSGRSPDWLKVKNPDASAATRILPTVALRSSSPAMALAPRRPESIATVHR